MFQKLKRTLIFVPILSVVLSLGCMGVASAAPAVEKPGSNGTTSNTGTVLFACEDDSVELKIAKANSKHEVAVTCKSSAVIVYQNYAGKKLTSVTVACATGEVYASSTPAKSRDPYLFYCVKAAQPTVRTKTNPKVEYKAFTSGSATTPTGDPAAVGGNCTHIDGCDLISKYIDPLIKLLAALVGVVVVISIVIGGIQYGSSAGDPQKTSAARARIRNAVIALITFIFLYSMLNFLVPGGLM